MQNYKILHFRNKAYWGESTGVLHQKDAHFSFQINPHGVEGWYGFPRQSTTLQQVEIGTHVLDYGINIRDASLSLKHPLLTQDQVDAIVFQSYLMPDANWLVANHRDDRFKVQLSQQWLMRNYRTIYDQQYTPEPGLLQELSYAGAVFCWDSVKVFCAKEISGKIYVADIDGPFIEMADGKSPSIAATNSGDRILTYERDGLIYIRRQARNIWQPEVQITANSEDFFPGQWMYDPNSLYTSPRVLLVEDRIWIFYIRTLNGEATIEYRLAAQKYLFAHSISTMYGPKTSLAVYQIVENVIYKGGIMISWINWDWVDKAHTARVPNLYFVKSSPPQQEYGRDSKSVATQGNHDAVVDSFGIGMTDSCTIEMRKVI